MGFVMTDAEIVGAVAIELSDECIVLSGADFDRKPFAIMIDDWQETKDAIDAMLSEAKPNLSVREQILADPELAKQMIFFGVEAMYAKDQVYLLEYTDRKYRLILKCFGTKGKEVKNFDTADELKAEFLKLKPTNHNRDFDAEFDGFMNGVKKTKEYWGIE